MLAAALLVSCKQAEMKSPEPTPKPGIELAFDVPQGDAAQVVHVVTRDISAGGEIPWHTHPGVEIAYVESGNVELEMAGKGVLKLGPGGHFMVPRGAVHSGRNAGKAPARLVLTYVVDKGATLRMPAEPPEEASPEG
jgi:quercetin dioxygenase-like cupin family protein